MLDWRLVPSSLGFREFNPCHHPAGSPDGGQFAPKGTGNCEGPTKDGRAKALEIISRQEDFDHRAAAAAMGSKFQQAVAGLMDAAPGAQAYLQNHLGTIVERAGGSMVPYTEITEGVGPRGAVGGIKGVRRVIEKAIVDGSGDPLSVKDIVRASVAVDSVGDVAPMIRAIKGRFDVFRVKNRFIRPTGEGYRDVLLNFRAPNGLIGEIQIHAKAMLKAKETKGHPIYMQMRRLIGKTGFGAKHARSFLAMRSAQIYRAAWASALAATAAIDLSRIAK